MNFEFFNPKKKELTSIRRWKIKTHLIRSVYKYLTYRDDKGQLCNCQCELGYTPENLVEDDGRVFPVCESCKNPFTYGDKYFACLTSPIRIRPYGGYGKVCFNCGIMLLANLCKLPIETLQMEYKEGVLC